MEMGSRGGRLSCPLSLSQAESLASFGLSGNAVYGGYVRRHRVSFRTNVHDLMPAPTRGTLLFYNLCQRRWACCPPTGDTPRPRTGRTCMNDENMIRSQTSMCLRASKVGAPVVHQVGCTSLFLRIEHLLGTCQ